MYSQSKGRQFGPGEQEQLVEYLGELPVKSMCAVVSDVYMGEMKGGNTSSPEHKFYKMLKSCIKIVSKT